MRQVCVLALAAAVFGQSGAPFFRLRVVDRETGRGVPLARLETTSKVVAWTDSNGVAAWNEPGLMDRRVYFKVESPGYSMPGEGRTLEMRRGGEATIQLDRLQVAERLYRVTGQGIYRDSELTGFPVPDGVRALNAGVMGQDTVRAAVYRGQVFWLWGDTDRPDGPLGNFNTTGAVSELAGADPSKAVELRYFTEGDFVKPMIPWTKRMTWMHSLMTLKDPAGRERLVSYYEVVKSLGVIEGAGLAVFDDEARAFTPLVEFPISPKPPLEANAFAVRADGRDYYYFSGLQPGGGVRVAANWDAVQRMGSYERLTESGWRPAGGGGGAKLTGYTDFETGKPLDVKCDGIAWNEFRKRWIAVLQVMPGEVYYAEADSPAGPWAYATKVATHGRYTFYWPVIHPFFQRDGGREVYFEGTYTNTFSGNPVITPRYDYNQLMYRLRLDDERLSLPAPVYRLRDGRLLMKEGVAAAKAWHEVESVAFYALAPDRPRPETTLLNGAFRVVGDGSATERP
ncbi:MAG: hypothetical protein HY821_21045, partial [Acidobacteria bacterium]|nr:hypothetical protein [Acidobacteriota bacterium]